MCHGGECCHAWVPLQIVYLAGPSLLPDQLGSTVGLSSAHVSVMVMTAAMQETGHLTLAMALAGT